MATPPVEPTTPRSIATVRQLLASTRYFLLIAVVGAFVTSVATLIYGGLETLRFVLAMAGPTTADQKQVAISAIQIIDLFLLATVFYIIALGLYELFIDSTLPMPHWLEFKTLDDLKDKLLRVVVVLLAVLFLGQIVQWKGGTDILALGAAVALVIGAISFFLWLDHLTGTGSKRNGES